MADKEFHPFLHSSCKWWTTVPFISDCAGASWKQGFGLSAGGWHQQSTVKIFLSHDSKIFYCHLIMLLLRVNTLWLLPLAIQGSTAKPECTSCVSPSSLVPAMPWVCTPVCPLPPLQELWGEGRGHLTRSALSQGVERSCVSSQCPYLAQTNGKQGLKHILT